MLQKHYKTKFDEINFLALEAVTQKWKKISDRKKEKEEEIGKQRERVEIYRALMRTGNEHINFVK